MQEYRPMQDRADLDEIPADFFIAEKEQHMEALMEREAESKVEMGYEVKSRRKIGRNEKCPCGSDKKFKKCCIRKAISK